MGIPTNISNVIIDFLWEKKELIDKYIRNSSNYVTEKDLEEIKKWPIHYKIKIISKLSYLKDYEYAYDKIKDSDICPWCVITNSECVTCTYGVRHRLCGVGRSNYTKIINSIHSRHKILGNNKADQRSIKSVPSMEKLIMKYSRICVEILRQMDNITTFR